MVTLSPLDIRFETEMGKFQQLTLPSDYDYSPRNNKSDLVVTQPK